MADQKPKPVYVLCGDDAFLRDQYTRQIVSQVAGEADPKLCASWFDGAAELADVLDELRTPSLLTPRRVVIVRDADAFVSAYRQNLEKYLQAAAPDSTLVLMVSSFPSNRRLYKLVAEIGDVYECSAGDDLGRWIRQAARRRGKQIDPDAAEMLAQWIGADLGALDGQIEKLSLYVGDAKKITVEDIISIVTDSAGPVRYAITNAICAADARAALEALARLLRQRGQEYQVLGSIGWHLRRSLAVKQDIDAGRRVRLRMPSAAREAFLRYVRGRPRAKLHQDMQRLLQADLAIKTGGDAVSVLQTLLVQLCS